MGAQRKLPPFSTLRGTPSVSAEARRARSSPPQQRGAALRLAQERLDDQKPYLFLWADRIPVVLSPTVATLDGPVDLNTPMYLWNVERWYLNR